MLVKTCGIMTKEAADTAVQTGADFIGFVFAPSKRYMTADQAAEIAKTIPQSVKKVGVFVNETAESITSIAEKVGLDYIQLHGDEPADFAEQLPYSIIKAFPATPDSFAQIKDYPCDYYLIDSPFGSNRGGNGTMFDWAILKELNLDTNKLILAGGLTPENVQQAISLTEPIGVDVSSGIETNGSKDLSKIKNFIVKAKG
ncbi:phosphoribosylanthranilate isomerase [Virgibacillus necropolis]|uniref:N-(5'-phosphoribosyl)anthranilate isomerase n=1 Tax=Virgibacillus necropolis TaxID=163877 RepID=A0A221MHT7_9BACI|nr:phosphoribosylanthranilate isomerase [Virgibacillus necropolis]ASN07223.1 phosphoribosylanthranilate isomerase [Virgibacillus necropolis]